MITTKEKLEKLKECLGDFLLSLEGTNTDNILEKELAKGIMLKVEVPETFTEYFYLRLHEHVGDKLIK